MSSKEKPLTGQQKIFCNELIFDWNATRSYKVAYPNVKNDNVAAACAAKLLRIAKIQTYIEDIQADLVKLTGLTKIKILKRHAEIAFDKKEKTKDQQSSLDSISKMLGHNEPKKIDITTKGKEMNSVSLIREAFGLDKVKNPLDESNT